MPRRAPKRRVATFFEKWNFLIETYLPVRRAPINDCPLRAFRRGSLLEYGGLNPILPFLGGRSDAARRVVILLAAVPSPYQPLTIPPPSPYHRPTFAAAPSDFMPKSEGAAALVLRMYGGGTAQEGRSTGGWVGDAGVGRGVSCLMRGWWALLRIRGILRAGRWWAVAVRCCDIHANAHHRPSAVYTGRCLGRG